MYNDLSSDPSRIYEKESFRVLIPTAELYTSVTPKKDDMSSTYVINYKTSNNGDYLSTSSEKHL